MSIAHSIVREDEYFLIRDTHQYIEHTCKLNLEELPINPLQYSLDVIEEYGKHLKYKVEQVAQQNFMQWLIQQADYNPSLISREVDVQSGDVSELDIDALRYEMDKMDEYQSQLLGGKIQMRAVNIPLNINDPGHRRYIADRLSDAVKHLKKLNSKAALPLA